MRDATGHNDVIEAALRRLARHGRPPGPAPRPGPAAQAPQPRPGERRPVLTLDPPRAPADPRAVAALLADDTAAKLDQLWYIWNVVRELEPFEGPAETPLRRRAAELLLVAAGGAVDLPLEGPLRAVRSFLAAHDMAEAYIDRLCAWYLPGSPP